MNRIQILGNNEKELKIKLWKCRCGECGNNINEMIKHSDGNLQHELT